MSLFYDSDEYEVSSSAEIDSLLAELPFELIKESILEQINDPLSSTTNYIDIILDKCEVFKAQYGNDESVAREIDDSLREFLVSIMTAIDKKFDLGLDINGISVYSSAIEIGEALYKYFILRYNKNITKFFTKFIFRNKKMLAEAFMDKSKKDVSTLAFKKKIKNSDDLCILTNLSSIMKYIIDLDIDSMEFLSLSAGEDNYEASIIRRLISSGQLMNDFYRSYVGLCVDSHDYIIDKIQTDIRIKILS